ncbi:Heavy metal-associated isoprenylated plant protein 8 [Cucurbita argyrosperma subsp. argyrosperma]|uniref:Heavy metal-associated isoprenylated plant protein 7-like n=1 Tax=Cucurbita moschata TaxID=3662 RepID=A0A6J1GDA6_CUCMO|nr:heavy metal-associated isoprenylated plant protein 7-like [Cucurbita moschata]XP_022949886.1 heavy metal-associated isoprenylated plant protein 7-like [Cucurbita moschata]KAG7034012.1 Heavy metal-associated isoprenylated plant protein 8 [Cucurbita argyrosperma subsp. argyrosperma]
MGEEIKKKEEGEDQKKEEAKEEKKEATESAAATTPEEEKKQESKKNEDESPPEIVLKVDMHCEACARKVARALKGFQGVENVTTDSRAGKVVVKGKEADPLKVCERLQKKSGRKVELISPLPKPAPEEQQPKEDDKQPKEEKKEEAPPPPAVVTVVLNVQMHCEACAQVLKKRIKKFKGVESVETELASNQVIVKGVMDPSKLVDHVSKRSRRPASIVVKEEEKKEEEKKEEEKPAAEEKPEEKKETQEEDDKKFDIKRLEYWPSTKYYTEYAYVPERLFSDENPNACSIM